jgi:tetratricopeptide (TPR) repeat protein
MKHTAQILELVESGQTDAAHLALDNLLSMGPSNLEALKLRARLYEVTGKFHEEAKTWEQVGQIDRTDTDLYDYLLKRQAEDKEHFYFTDTLPGGGKKFLAFPRRMVRAAVIGLLGCLAFLIVAKLGQAITPLTNPWVVLGTFTLLVMGPWAYIVTTYLQSLRHISVDQNGLELAARFKKVTMAWSEIERICLASEDRSDVFQLKLVMIPVDTTKPSVELDFDEATAPVRARSYLIREIGYNFKSLEYIRRADLDRIRPTVVKF